jgi:hypothetical protein
VQRYGVLLKSPNLLGTFFEKSDISLFFELLPLLFHLQMRQTDVVFHGQHPDNDHTQETGNNRYLNAQIAPDAKLIYDTANDTGYGVNLLAENEWHLIDEHITHHTAGSTRYATHHDCHPERLAHEERLLNAGYGEQG